MKIKTKIRAGLLAQPITVDPGDGTYVPPPPPPPGGGGRHRCC